MRRIFLISLFGLCFGAFTYVGIVPQHAFAATRLIHRQVAVTALEKKEYVQLDHEAYIKMMDHQPDKIYAQPESPVKKGFKNAPGTLWPSISLPDISFLWKQQHSSEKKDIYDRGQ